MASTVWLLGPERAINNWRSTWPAEALRGAGVDAHAVCPDGERDADLQPGDTVVVHHSNQHGAFAPGHKMLAPFLQVIRRDVAPRLLVVQWDDSYLDAPDIQDCHDSDGRPLPGFVALLDDLAACCRIADRVIVTTPYLQERLTDYAADVRVVPNWIARWVTELELPERLGSSAVWMGTLGGIPEPGRRRSAHLHDWEWALNGKETVPNTPTKIVGVREYREHRWFAERLGPRYSYARATFDLAKLYKEMAAGTCVGLAPVDPSLGFNRAKSWIKPMEYAALGLRSVAAPTDEYRRLDFDAAVNLTDADKFWPAVEFWVDHEAGEPRNDWLRSHVANKLTVEANVGDWMEALDL